MHICMYTHTNNTERERVTYQPDIISQVSKNFLTHGSMVLEKISFCATGLRSLMFSLE